MTDAHDDTRQQLDSLFVTYDATHLMALSSEPLLLDPIKAGRVRVVGATYDLDTGTVDFFDL